MGETARTNIRARMLLQERIRKMSKKRDLEFTFATDLSAPVSRPAAVRIGEPYVPSPEPPPKQKPEVVEAPPLPPPPPKKDPNYRKNRPQAPNMPPGAVSFLEPEPQKPAEEAPAEEAPAEAPVEEAPAEEAPVEEAPKEGTDEAEMAAAEEDE